MNVYYSLDDGRITQVLRADSEENAKADLATQGIINVDQAANANVFVRTPSGSERLTHALMMRTGAFSVVGGELVHDTEWTDD